MPRRLPPADAPVARPGAPARPASIGNVPFYHPAQTGRPTDAPSRRGRRFRYTASPARLGPRIEPLEGRRTFSTYFVAPTGADANPGTLRQPLQTIQHALDLAAQPGDTVEVRGGTYHEMLTLDHGGSAAGGPVTLEAYPGEHVLLSGAGAASDDVGFGNNMVQIINQSYVRVSGLEIAYDSGVSAGDDACGVRVQGSGTDVVVSNNVIHDITGKVLSSAGGNNTGYGGAGIQVYGSSLTDPYANVTLDGNTIYNCQPGDSETETLTVNGNVTGFRITHNLIHDDNNIGIDMIGGEADVFGKPAGTPNLPVARNGVCTGNTVYNIHANYGGGFAAGIYVDGGKDITVQANVSRANDMGLEVGSENSGYTATGVVAEDNSLYRNTQAGLVFGGYASGVGRVRGCSFLNNTVYQNDTLGTGGGQLLIQYASDNVVTNNIFVAAANGLLVGSAGAGNVGNRLDYNLYFVAPPGTASPASGAPFAWNAASYDGLAAYQGATGEDVHSAFADPAFADVAADDFRLAPGSPAVGAGSAAAGQYAPTNFDGASRSLPPDVGAYAVAPATPTPAPGPTPTPAPGPPTPAPVPTPVPLTDVEKVRADLAVLAADRRAGNATLAADQAASRAAARLDRALVATDKAKAKTDRHAPELLSADLAQLSSDRLRLRAGAGAAMATLARDKATLSARVRADALLLRADKIQLHRDKKAGR